MVHIPLGPRPWLHRLRGGWARLVRRFPSYYGGVRLPASVHHRLRLLTFPMRTRAEHCRWPNAGSPSFRCIPFARDVLLDPGRTAMPRITALLMLRSTISTVSAPATCLFRGSIANPTQLLCTLRGRRYRRLTQHSLLGGPLRPYPHRSFTGWNAPALAGAFGNDRLGVGGIGWVEAYYNYGAAPIAVVQAIQSDLVAMPAFMRATMAARSVGDNFAWSWVPWGCG